jgi:hypothetical protein
MNDLTDYSDLQGKRSEHFHIYFKYFSSFLRFPRVMHSAFPSDGAVIKAAVLRSCLPEDVMCERCAAVLTYS